jgi:hypothetical protein
VRRPVVPPESRIPACRLRTVSLLFLFFRFAVSAGMVCVSTLMPGGACHVACHPAVRFSGRQERRDVPPESFRCPSGRANGQTKQFLKEELNMKKQKQRPHIIKATRGVRAKIWRNSNKNGAWFNVNFVRTYQDEEGELQDSDSFSRDDLLPLAYAVGQAFEYIMDQNDEAEPDEE